jgi:hypothetical protein
MMPWTCKPWFPDSSLRRPDTSVNTSTRGSHLNRFGAVATSRFSVGPTPGPNCRRSLEAPGESCRTLVVDGIHIGINRVRALVGLAICRLCLRRYLVLRRGAESDRAGRYLPAAYRRCPARSSKRRSAPPRATMNSWKQSPTPSTNARKNCANGAERIQSAAFRQTSITLSRNSHRARVPPANPPNQRSRAGRQDLPVAFTGFAGCLPPIIRERNRFDPWMRLPAPKSCELSRRPMRFSRQPIHNTFLPPPD